MRPMKTLSIILSKKPSAQWEEWINALVRSGFVVKVIEPSGAGPNAYEKTPGDAVLLDGLLPHLDRFVGYLDSLFPGLPAIVAMETNSSTITYETMRMIGVDYVSGPLSPAQFVEAIRGMAVGHPEASA